MSSPPVTSGTSRHLVVSPHFDDAVLAVTGLLASARDRVTVATVCARPPDPALPASEWDRACGFTTGAEAARARAREDLEACARVGAEPLHLPFLDGAYRDGLDASALRQHVASALDADTALWLPAGLGSTPDHLAVRDALLPLAAAHPGVVVLYGDSPYAAQGGWDRADGDGPHLDACRAAGLEPGATARIRLRERELAEKLELVPLYASQVRQLDALFPGLLAPGGPLATEVRWVLTPAPAGDGAAPAAGRPAAVLVCARAHASPLGRRLAEAVAGGLERLRPGVSLVDELPPPGAGHVALVVSPHEFLAGAGLAEAERAGRALAGAVCLCTAEPGAPLFDELVPFLGAARAVLHVSEPGASTLAERGVEATHLPLGRLPGGERLDAPSSPRPVEVAATGLATPYRLHGLARSAPVLAAREVRIELRQSLLAEGRARDAEVDPSPGLLASSELMLHVPTGAGAPLPWLRVAAAVDAGAVVVAEHAAGLGPLEPGRDVLVGHLASLPLLVDLALEERGRLDALRRSAARTLEEAYPWERTLQTLLETVRRPSPAAPPARPARTLGARSPLLEHERALAESADAGPAASAAATEAALARVLLDVAALRRQVTALRPPRPEERLTTPTYSAARPEVSVVIPVHDDELYVEDALASVAAAQGVALEVVVVDDGSEDASPDRVAAFLERHPGLPATLLRLPLNRGVAAARNAGYAEARAPLVFNLDADDRVYPRGIERLRAALAEDGRAAFAYGLIDLADEEGPFSLISYGPWDPGRLRAGNYIASAALVRRDAWEHVGGYDERTPLLLTLWEDYDFWLRCAARGLHGVHVPQFAASYRQRRGSRNATSRLLGDTVAAMLRHRYASVFTEGGE